MSPGSATWVPGQDEIWAEDSDVGPQSSDYEDERTRLMVCAMRETKGNLRSLGELKEDAAKLAGSHEAEMAGLIALLALSPATARRAVTVSGVQGGESVVVTTLTRQGVGGRREWGKGGISRIRMRRTKAQRLRGIVERAPVWVREAAEPLGVEIGGDGDE